MNSLQEMQKQNPWSTRFVVKQGKNISDEIIMSNKKDDVEIDGIVGEYDEWGMPVGTDVIPLGGNHRFLYFLNQSKEFIELKDSELSSQVIRNLFGSQCMYLWAFFPKYDKDGKAKESGSDYDTTKAQNCLISACARKNARFGVFNAGRRLRDAGAWIDDDDNLIYHYGDKILKITKEGEEVFLPGEVDGYVYSASAKLNKPADKNCPDWNSVQYFYDDLHTWNWVDHFAPKLLLGWIAESFVGGALDWRGVIWINGDAGTGKSSITEKMLSGLFGDGILTSANYTEAAVRQVVGAKHLPVALDELEAGANYQKQTALIELARAAASGSKAFRGGQDHNATEFELKSCFAFSSINLPPMKPQDRQRIAILNLNKLKNTKEPDMSVNRLKKVGSIIQRRMLDGWHQLKDIIEKYRQEFEQYTTNARVIKVYGTMLACADLVLYGKYDEEHASDYVDEICKYVELVNREGGTNSSKCLEWLMSFEIHEYQAGKTTNVGHLIDVAARGSSSDTFTSADANEILMRQGLKVLRFNEVDYLFVANSHKNLSNIFRETDWVGVAGAVGGWAGALLSIDGSMRSPKTVRLDGWTGRGVLVPVESLGLFDRDVL